MVSLSGGGPLRVLFLLIAAPIAKIAASSKLQPIAVSASDGGALKTPSAAFDMAPPIVLLSPPPEGARLPAVDGAGATLNISYEIFAPASLLEYFQAQVCVQFESIKTLDDKTEQFELLNDGESICFPGRARELKATGLAAGDYRVNITARVARGAAEGAEIKPTPLAHARFKVLKKVPFTPTYDWQRVEDWQDVMSGLDVKMPIGGMDFRKARIPATWKLQAWVLDDAGKAKGAGAFARIHIKRRESLLSVRAAVAAAMKSSAPCLTMSIGGSEKDWTALERSANSTVEGAELFERGLPIAGTIDRENGICSCFPPDKGRACTAVLTRLETCEKKVGSEPDSRAFICADEAAAVEECFTTCSVQGDPYALDAVRVIDAEDANSTNDTLAWAVGHPELPLQKGWSELTWNSVEDWPATNNWAHCKYCSYRLGTWGGLILHRSSDDSQFLKDQLPSSLASSRQAPWFRTQRGSIGSSALEIFHTEYDESSSSCGSGARVVSSPTFIASVWEVLNVHHLVAELILPLYRSIVERFGAFRNDALVFLEVGQAEQAPRLQQLMQQAAPGDSSLGLLTRITRRPVASAASLEKGIKLASGGVQDGDESGITGNICFRDLQLGLNLQTFPTGRLVQQLDFFSSQGLEAMKWQQALRQHMLGENPPSPAVPLPPGVLFIKRLQTRKFKNFIELKSAARTAAKAASDAVLATTTTTTAPDTAASRADDSVVVYPPTWKGWTNEIVLERAPFSEQITKLREATVVVAVHGQGAFNALLMRPGSSLVLIVPPKFDGEKFLFANMAVANGMHVFLVENEGKSMSEDANISDDARRELLNEAKLEKDTWVEPANFGEVLKVAINVAAGQSSKEPARVHFLQDILETAAERKKKLEAEKKEREDKRARESKNMTGTQQPENVSESVSEREQSDEELKVLEEIRQAKAQLALLEQKLADLIPATHEEL